MGCMRIRARELPEIQTNKYYYADLEKKLNPVCLISILNRRADRRTEAASIRDSAPSWVPHMAG